MKRPRPSSLPALKNGDPNPEWLITEDGHPFQVGDRIYNYYDGLWGKVMSEPDPTAAGSTSGQTTDDGPRSTVRVSKRPPG